MNQLPTLSVPIVLKGKVASDTAARICALEVIGGESPSVRPHAPFCRLLK
jgi:hypothetical protein